MLPSGTGCVCVTEFSVMIVLYARVSTADQTTAHQVTQAKAAGFKIDEVVSDEGVAGIATKLCEREQGKRLFDMLQRSASVVSLAVN
jgi:putative DNA-invertase from lambdoid prophage Rac